MYCIKYFTALWCMIPLNHTHRAWGVQNTWKVFIYLFKTKNCDNSSVTWSDLIFTAPEGSLPWYVDKLLKSFALILGFSVSGLHTSHLNSRMLTFLEVGSNQTDLFPCHSCSPCFRTNWQLIEVPLCSCPSKHFSSCEYSWFFFYTYNAYEYSCTPNKYKINMQFYILFYNIKLFFLLQHIFIGVLHFFFFF